MDWRCGGALIILLGGFLCGCTGQEPQAARVAAAVRAPPPAARASSSSRQRVLRRAGAGAILAVFPGTEEGVADAASGLTLAADACALETCSVALFAQDGEAEAVRWIRAEVARRRAAGVPLRVALAGYGYGGAAAGETVRRLLRLSPQVPVDLLITVDAIRKGAIPFAKGTTASLVTLDRPLGGRGRSFFAYDGAPQAGANGPVQHVNYYQTASPFLRGASMAGATENYEVVRRWEGAVRHGNIDNYVSALVQADLLAFCRRALP
ncbi:MAG: hypothetical protein ACOCX4_01175 [Planctomycetota bacterium]